MILCLAGIFLAGSGFAQQARKQPAKPAVKMTPEMTEYWTPQPKIITPGKLPCDGFTTAPSDADVLFDGRDLSEWINEKGEKAEWIVDNGVITVKKGTGFIITKKKYNDFQLHIEWKVPTHITGKSQARGNSGIMLQGMYEIQVLDNFDNPTYVNGQAASVYKQTAPLVNAMRPPGEWNIYDIIYTAPTFKEDGTYRTYPYVTVIHNGVLVQNHTRINGTTPYVGYPKVVRHGEGPIKLQDHGDPSKPISFRNIWIRKL